MAVNASAGIDNVSLLQEKLLKFKLEREEQVEFAAELKSQNTSLLNP